MKTNVLKGFNFRKVGQGIKRGWDKNGLLICTIVAAGCAVAAVVEAVKAGPTVKETTEARKGQIDYLTSQLQDGDISQEEFKKGSKDANIEAAKEYACALAPAVGLLGVSVASTAFGYKISIGKQAALLTAYKALELKSDEFMAKAKEVIGEKKVDNIKTAVVKDHVAKADIPEGIKSPEYEKDADGNFVAKPYMYPCWEDQSGRPFMGSPSTIDVAMRKASAICYSRGTVTLNDIFELLDPNSMYLPPNAFGESHGFVDRDLNADKMIPYHTKAIDRDGFDHPFTALIFDLDPVNLVLDGDY